MVAGASGPEESQPRLNLSNDAHRMILVVSVPRPEDIVFGVMRADDWPVSSNSKPILRCRMGRMILCLPEASAPTMSGHPRE